MFGPRKRLPSAAKRHWPLANAGHGRLIPCPRAASGRRGSMLGLASKVKAGHRRRARLAPSACLRWSRAANARGTAKTRADWEFVSGVSPVPPNLKLIDRQQQWKRHRRPLVGATPPALRQVRQAQAPQTFVVRQQGRDTGETTGTAENPLNRKQGVTVPLFELATRFSHRPVGNAACRTKQSEAKASNYGEV